MHKYERNNFIRGNLSCTYIMDNGKITDKDKDIRKDDYK
jgi:hypothetical protein